MTETTPSISKHIKTYGFLHDSLALQDRAQVSETKPWITSNNLQFPIHSQSPPHVHGRSQGLIGKRARRSFPPRATRLKYLLLLLLNEQVDDNSIRQAILSFRLTNTHTYKKIIRAIHHYLRLSI